MKGITIILVIIGHESWVPLRVKTAIYSFHMPLFFILAGLFHKETSLKKDISRLIIPYLAMGVALLAYHLICNLPSLSIFQLKRDLLKIFWASGAGHRAPLFGDKPVIGAIWFLMALFWCKRLYSLLCKHIESKTLLGTTCLALSLSAILCDNYLISLPLGLLPGIAAIIFFYIGANIKSHNIPAIIIIICVGCLISMQFLPYLSLARCYYGIYPIYVLGACGGTWLIYEMSKLATHSSVISSLFSWLGMVTLPILCFHLFQLNTQIFKPGNLNNSFMLLSALTFPLIATCLASCIKPTRQLFGIPDSANLLPLFNKK